jgi:hypothetical protein
MELLWGPESIFAGYQTLLVGLFQGIVPRETTAKLEYLCSFENDLADM